MNELIRITDRQIGGGAIATVNARDLHAFLEVGKVFGAWISERIEQYEFREHQDFEVYSDSGNNPKGGRPAKEYAVSLDMAKELAMVERNEKGKQARQYFIECERLSKTAPQRDPLEVLNDPVAMRGLLLGYTERVLALEAKVQADAPKLQAHDRLVDADGLMNLTNAAKALQVEPGRIFKLVRTKGWVYRRPGAKSDVAYQDKIAAGYLTHKVYVAKREDGSERICEQVMVTPKGLIKLAALIQDGSH